MENMIKKLNDYNPNREKYKTEKTNNPSHAIKVYKGRKMILIDFQNGIPYFL